jgi:hypothetical protein
MAMAREMSGMTAESVSMMSVRVSVVPSMTGVSPMMTAAVTSVMSTVVPPMMSAAVTAPSERSGRSDNDQIGAGEQRHQ